MYLRLHLRSLYLLPAALLLLLLLALAAPVHAATGPELPSGVTMMSVPGSILGPQAASQNDDNTLEFGVWWVEEYNPTSSGCITLSNLPATRPDALGLKSRLTSTYYIPPFFSYPTPTWSSVFTWGNSSAWEEDWKRQDLGGTNETYVDSVDLAYFAGHGSTAGLYFGKGGCTKDDQILTYTDARGAWGNKDMDWAGLAACNVLDDSRLGNWANTMAGLRLILGFKTVMNDVPHGDSFGYYLRFGYSLTQAWFKAADNLQSQGRIARVLAEHSNYFNDTWANHNSPTTVDNTYHWWTHSVGSEPARLVDLGRLNNTMPIFQVQPLALDEVSPRFEALGAAFGVNTRSNVINAAAIGASASISVTADAQLEMDTSYGLFTYSDTSALWTDKTDTLFAASGTAMTAISSEEARQIAEAFLTQNNLLPDDAQFYEVYTNSMTTAEAPTDVFATGVGQILAEEPTEHQVIFSRILTYNPPAVNGAAAAADPVEFSVMGPGAKLKIFVDTAVPAGLSAADRMNQAVIGGVGGYRSVDVATQVNAQGIQVPQMVDVLPYATVAKLFEQMEPNVALSYVPLPFTSREIISHTAAYWEGSIGWSQDQLIPVYALTVRSIVDGETIEYDTFIPVNPLYMAPLARIQRVTGEGNGVLPGQTIKLQALDAAQNLADLGFDAAFDFPLGSGDLYLYSWYLNEISEETKLGTGRTLDYVVPMPDLSKGEGNQVIILEVKDSTTPRQPNSSTANFSLQVLFAYMPTMSK